MFLLGLEPEWDRVHGKIPLLYFSRMKSTALVSVLETCLPISMLLQSTALVHLHLRFILLTAVCFSSQSCCGAGVALVLSPFLL